MAEFNPTYSGLSPFHGVSNIVEGIKSADSFGDGVKNVGKAMLTNTGIPALVNFFKGNSDGLSPFTKKISDSFDNLLTGQRDYDRNKGLQDIANKFNVTEAQKARDFSERMSNTAYQRAVADMKAAGLNPALLYSSGGVASTPATSAAHSASASAGNSSQALTSLIGTVGQLILGGVRLGNSAAAARTPKYTQYVNRYGEIVGTTVRGQF